MTINKLLEKLGKAGVTNIRERHEAYIRGSGLDRFWMAFMFAQLGSFIGFFFLAMILFRIDGALRPWLSAQAWLFVGMTIYALYARAQGRKLIAVDIYTPHATRPFLRLLLFLAIIVWLVSLGMLSGVVTLVSLFDVLLRDAFTGGMVVYGVCLILCWLAAFREIGRTYAAGSVEPTRLSPIFGVGATVIMILAVIGFNLAGSATATLGFLLTVPVYLFLIAAPLYGFVRTLLLFLILHTYYTAHPEVGNLS